MADSTTQRDNSPESIERAMQSAEAFVRACRCETCLVHAHDVLHYFVKHRTTLTYCTSDMGPTALVTDAHIYAEALVRYG